MTAGLVRRSRWLLVLAAVVGCGTGDLAGDDDHGFADATPSDQDAGPTPDAPAAGCAISFAVDPPQPVVGDEVTVSASIERPWGPVQPVWTVWDEQRLPVTIVTSLDRSSVQFRVATAGLHEVQLDPGLDSGCSTGQQLIDVTVPGAPRQQWWLQVVFPDRLAVPPLEQTIWVGSASADVVADEASRVDLAVIDTAGAPVAAMVRWSRTPRPQRPYAVPVEARSDGSGRVRTRLRDHDNYEVLVVPDCPLDGPCPLAPTLYRPWFNDGSSLVAIAGQEIAGAVQDRDGHAVVGARVALTVDGVPSTVATTDGSGGFAVRTSRLGTATVVVAPAAGSGLPRLAASIEVIAGGDLDITYSTPVRSMAGTLVELGATPVAAAQVTMVGELAGAGTVRRGAATATASGRFEAGALTSVSGRLPALLAPAAPLSAVIETSPLVWSVVAVDLTSSLPASLRALPATTLAGRVSAPDGGSPGPVRIRAVPSGPLAAATRWVAGELTAQDGTFSLPAAAGASYDLVATDPGERFSEGRTIGIAGGATADVALTAALIVERTMLVDGVASDALRGGSVVLRCLDCSGIEQSRAVATTIIGSGGRFRLTAPAPPATARPPGN